MRGKGRVSGRRWHTVSPFRKGASENGMTVVDLRGKSWGAKDDWGWKGPSEQFFCSWARDCCGWAQEEREGMGGVMDCWWTFAEWGKAAWNHLLGLYGFSNKNVKVFSHHFENVITCKTVLMPVTKAAFPMVNSSPRCNNVLFQVFLRFKPGVRFGRGPFRVPFDPSQ